MTELGKAQQAGKRASKQSRLTQTMDTRQKLGGGWG